MRCWPIKNVLRKGLLPLGWLYGLIGWLRNKLFDAGWLTSWQAPVPVISVGNLSAGGTGKTPLAAAILAHFDTAPHPPGPAAYLSRGYGRQSKGYHRIQADGSARLYGDEAWQMYHHFSHLPVAVSEDRRTGIQQLFQQKPKPGVVVLDDAFQHRWVERDCNIVVIDANRPPWRDHLLPAGYLREPMASLQRADLIVISKIQSESQITEAKTELSKWKIPLVFCRPRFSAIRWVDVGREDLPLTALAGRKLSVLAGIGQPEAFAWQITQAGAEIQNRWFFPDHYPFQAKDFQQFPTDPDHWILTTEKDYYRLKGESWLTDFPHLSLAYLPIELEWLEGEKRLWNSLAEAVAARD